jgi:hypothetical protein
LRKPELYNLNNVHGVQSFGALLALKLDGIAFIERLIAVRLNGGKVDKNILSARTLNKSVSLGSIEPLDDALLPHSISPFLVDASISTISNTLARLAPEAPGRKVAQKRREPPKRPRCGRRGGSMAYLSWDCGAKTKTSSATAFQSSFTAQYLCAVFQLWQDSGQDASENVCGSASQTGMGRKDYPE